MFSLTADRIVMGIIVLAAGFWAIRAVYTAAKNKSVCSDCSSSGDCPLTSNPDALAQLAQSGQMGKLDHCQSSPVDCQSLLDSLDPKDPDKAP